MRPRPPGSAGPALVEATGICRTLGERPVVAGVDLRLAPGECLTILGPNGAGKSTLLRMVATLLRPDSGTLRVAGHECPAHAAKARPHLGLLGHEPQVYRDLSALQNLEFFASLHGLARDRERELDALERVGLLARANDPVRTFSRGMGQRLGLARLLLHDPPILLLDEPHAGLDASGAALLDRQIADRPAGRGIILVTHEVERGIALADRAMVLRAGRCVLDEDVAGTDPAAFRRRYEDLIR